MALETPLPRVAALALTALVACTPADAPADRAGDARMDELEAALDRTLDDLVLVAEAFPEDDYPWRPVEEVRSVGSVIAHVAAVAYYVPTFLGVEAPPETGIRDDPTTLRTAQEMVPAKAGALDLLRSASLHLRGAFAETSSAPERVVEFEGREMTVRRVWLETLHHLTLHLGQTIAYLRVAGVEPPVKIDATLGLDLVPERDPQRSAPDSAEPLPAQSDTGR